MNERMIYVEKVVRPLRASTRHKNKMREELLAHFHALYEEELERSTDPQSAIQSAIRRFGPQQELSADLSGVVPWYDVVLRFPRSISQLTLWALAWTAIVEIPFLALLARIFSGRWFDPEMVAVSCLALLVVPVIVAYGCGFTGAMHGVLGHVKSARAAVLYTTAYDGYLVTCSLFLEWPNPAFHVFYPAVWTVIIAGSSYGMGICFVRDERSAREWESLNLEG